MNSQDVLYRDRPSSPRGFEIPVNFPSGTGDDISHHLALEDHREPSLLSPDTVLESPPTYEATVGLGIRHAHQAEARKILCSEQFQLIQNLLRFRLYGPKDSLRHTLQHCWTHRLDNILTLLKDDEQRLAMLKKDQKVDKILELVDPTRDFSHVGWRWAPYNAINTDVEQIAANIEEESYSLFRRVHFEDWVRYLAGYEEESVEDLFFQHRVLTHKIHCYLLRHRDERGKYTQVTEALLHCLSSASYLPTSLSLPFNLEVISGPLGSLMGDQTLPLSAMLDILLILTIRFNHTYIRAMSFTWLRFTIRVDVLKALIASNPTEFAKNVMISDKKDFNCLCSDAFKT